MSLVLTFHRNYTLDLTICNFYIIVSPLEFTLREIF